MSTSLEDGLLPCLASSAPARDGGEESERGWLDAPLPGLDDAEGERVLADLPPVVDAHVHLFEDALFESLWRWFDRWAWPVRYRLYSAQAIDFLLARGVKQLVGLCYAHKPGIADGMNEAMAQLASSRPALTALGTVFPGEPDARGVVERAFARGLRGLKLHCHVQCFAPDAPELSEIYEACAEHGLPLVMHAGRQPKSPGYRCDPFALCSADRVELVLEAHPRLKLCVPHLGADEFSRYERLLERHDNLWLDTTMTVAGYFPAPLHVRALEARSERVFYGSDFPNIPYAWDRELRRLAALGLGDERLERVLGGAARALYGLPDLASPPAVR